MATVLILYMASAIVPGPNVVLVTQTAVSQTRAATMSAALGITSGVLLLASGAVTGLSALLTTAPGLTRGLRYGGAAYLILLGLRMWGRAKDEYPNGPAVDSTAVQNAYRRGLCTVVTNPQTLLFFGSILSTAMPRNLSVPERLTVIAVIVIPALCWFSGLAYLLTSRLGSGMLIHRKPLLNRILSTVMVFFGVSFLIA